jgi:lipopolysaccharide exporter
MTTQSIAHKVATGARWMIFLRFGMRGIGLVSTLIVARLLLPADFGLVALAMTFAGALDTLGSIGLQFALIRATTADRVLYDTAFTITVIRGIATAALVAGTAPLVARFFVEPRLVPIVLVIAGVTLLQSFENVGVILFQRDFRFDKDVALTFVSKAAAVAMTIVAALILHSYWALVIGIVTARVSRLILSYVMHPFRPTLTLKAWRSLLGFSMWIWLTTVSTFLREQADAFVIGRALGMLQIGVFKVGTEIASLTTTEIVQPICRALFPGFTAVTHSGKDVARFIITSASAIILIVVPAGAGLALVAEPLVRLTLGPNWALASDVLHIIGFAAVFDVIIEVNGIGLLAIGRPDVNAKAAVVCATVRIAFLIAGVVAMGFIGAAWGIFASAAIDCSIVLVIINRVLNVRFGELASLTHRTALAAAAMVAAVLAVNGGWPSAGTDFDSTARLLFGNAALGATVFVLTQLVCWLLAGRPDGPERMLQKLLRRRAVA